MTSNSTPAVQVNGRSYQMPRTPTVVVCVDGCEPDYLAQAVAMGQMPWLKRTLAQGTASYGGLSKIGGVLVPASPYW